MLPGLISLAAVALSTLLIVRALRPIGPVDALLFCVPVFSAHVLLAGFTLSALNALNSLDAWALASAVLLVASLVIIMALRVIQGAPVIPSPAGARNLSLDPEPSPGAAQIPRRKRLGMTVFNDGVRKFANLSAADRRLLVPLLFTVIVLALVNFDLARNAAPHNWDSMTYHLARMAYFLQHGNFNAYDANYWAQVTHPRNSTILTLYTFLVAGHNENLTQIVQFVAYLAATTALYGICRRLGRDRFASLFAACVFALLTECLMQATTTQNDMTLTAFVAIVVYCLLAYRERRRPRYLIMAGLSAGIMLGIKSSAFLAGPSLAAIALYATLIPPTSAASEHAASPRQSGEGGNPESHAGTTLPFGGKTRPLLHWHSLVTRGAFKPLLLLALAVLVSALAFALPAGYLENWQLFGSPIGTEYVRKLHAFEGEPLSYVLTNGTRNLFRFGLEFLSLDGLPPGGAFMELQQTIRAIPVALARASGLNLETAEATRAPFQYDKAPVSHEDGSYWGVLGFALVWPLALLALIGVIKSPGARVLALAAVLFVLAQAYSGPYDPWRGRYFIIAAVFAVPAVACCVRNTHPLWRIYLTVVVLLGCLSAFTATLGRSNDMPEDVYSMDRLQQLTRNRRNYTGAILRFDEWVPRDATVALYFGEDTFEYPLFGAGLTRTLIPINSFWRGPQPIPPQADYLLYSADLYTDRRGGDAHLGEDWYLRKLNGP
jgi:hypothetical protein